MEEFEIDGLKLNQKKSVITTDQKETLGLTETKEIFSKNNMKYLGMTITTDKK